MDNTLRDKLNHLKKILADTKGCAIAFSGGVDSTLLLAVAHEVLQDRCLAVVSTSSTYAQRECQQACAWIRDQNIAHEIICSEELDIPGFTENPPDRCYHCKHELFSAIATVAKKHGLQHVADGTNADDCDDYRPGMRAAEELNILSPLLQAQITKAEIRALSREIYQLPTADKPAMACLASRFPYGNTITPEKLKQIESLETFLHDNGFVVYRARHHDQIVRIELGPDEIARIADCATRNSIVEYAKTLGFLYVTCDLQGYRTGSMNEVLS